MYRLIAPQPNNYSAWNEALKEFGDGPIDGSGFFGDFHPLDLSPTAFEEYLSVRTAAADPTVPPPKNFVHCSYFWIVDEKETLLGFLALRHALTPFLLEQGGHIGYSVRPSARNQGVATAALELGLAEARALGIDDVLVCAKTDNIASNKVIERCGGAFESTINGIHRYWF